jgi:rhamnosyltransferase
MQKSVFLIGSKGIPARYGGFETFVEKLTKYWKRNDVKFHIAIPKISSKSDYEYNNSRCFIINISKLGSYRSILFDLISLRESLNYINRNKLAGSIIYMLTYRIGPFLTFFKYNIKKNKVKIYLNPDGLECNRKKWGRLGRLYWKISKICALKFADLIICDSIEIQKNILVDFNKAYVKTVYISYGAELKNSEIPYENPEITEWFINNNLTKNNYYLYVGRFIPENNIEFIINECIDSGSKKYLVLITNIDYEIGYYNILNKKLKLDKNKKLIFPGTVYNESLLKIIRENAFAYVHGHEVGGTNPSLLESLALTKINLVLKVVFNEEVCADSVLYFEKTSGSLKNLIMKIEKSDLHSFEDLSKKAKNRIMEYYTWDKIVKEYEKIF